MIPSPTLSPSSGWALFSRSLWAAGDTACNCQLTWKKQVYIILSQRTNFSENLPEGESVQKEFWDTLSLWKRTYSQAMEPVCAQYDLTRMELDILLFLANSPERDTFTQIVTDRQLSKSHVSTSVRHLEKEGYLRRQFLAGNRRTAHLVLLPPAKPVIEAGRRIRAKLIQTVFAGFSAEELSQLESFLRRMNHNVQVAHPNH